MINERKQPYAVELVPWTAPVRELLADVRMRVFVEEQGVPPELELDDTDACAIHAVAREPSGDVVGTGRLFAENLAADTTPAPRRTHIGRMAVLPEHRGRGCGAAILQALINRAREDGYCEVILSAQTHATAFYEKAGFQAVGDIYLDCEIAHQDMLLKLTDSENTTKA